MFFSPLLPQVVSSHTWSVLCWIFQETLCKLLRFSLGTTLPSGTVSCVLQLPWFSQTLNSVSSTQRIYQALPEFPASLHCSWETLSRQNTGAITGFTSFVSCLARLTWLHCPTLNVLKSVTSDILSGLGCIRWESKSSPCYTILGR